MADAFRYFVRSHDGRAVFGFANLEGAATAALAYGDGALVVDTLAQAYIPMLQTTQDGELIYAGYGGWDTGCFGLDRDFIEGIKKGHVAIVHGFLDKGAEVNARDEAGQTARQVASARGRADITELLTEAGAEA